MGYPYLPTPASEIIHYGYTPNLVEVRKGRPAKAKCHPEIQGNYGKLHAYSIPEIAQALERQWHAEYRQAHKVIDKEDSFEHVHELELQLWDDSSFGLDALEIGDNKDCYERRLERCIGVPADAGYRFWGYDAYSKGALKRFLIHDAGWRNTVSVPWDLGATDMQCRVLCHFGCSTLKHNRPIIRGKNHKNWRQEDDDHYGFFTDATAYMMTASRWIYHLLTYPEYNAFEPWKDSLKYAREQTNTDLKNMKQKFRIRAG
jgi:hypothetical protein